MRNFLIFLAGFISGIVFLFLVSLTVANRSSNGQIDGLTFFETPGEIIHSTSFKVFQVIDAGNALANAGERLAYSDRHTYYGMVVMFLADKNTHYYDDQVINVPKGKCVRQVGTYQYETSTGYKTVPVVAICDK